MNGIPQEVEDWIKSHDRPFTIFFTPEKGIVFVWGDGPWKNLTGYHPEDLRGMLDPRRYNYMDSPNKPEE